jgi:phospholipid transport system substrate-binding protein
MLQATSMRRVLGTLLAAGTAAILLALPASAADSSMLIESMISRINEIARTKTGADRQAAMREVVQNNFDLPYMGRSALGSYWNQASEQQRARFLAAVEASEARSYSERLGKYASYSLTIGRVRPQADSVWIVDTYLNQAGGQSISVEWKVRESGQGLRIGDVRVEGISLAMIMRSDFNSYILSHFGQIEPLVRVLEARAAR